MQLLLALALGAILAPALPADAGPKVCDSSSALTLLGIDTSSGLALFSLPGRGEGTPGWLVELRPGADSARLHPDRAKGRFGGSVGPGPVLAASPCGASCIQPLAWREGAWKPVGEQLLLPAAATVSTTYDESGRPWVLAHGQGESEGWAKAWAFRLEGTEWRSRGALAVTAAGSPPALPAPQRKDGVVSGTGLFSGSAQPGAWAAGLPTVPADRRGEVVALGGNAVAYLANDGAIYLSMDGGKVWRRATWTPWGSGTTGLWRQGSDYSVDLPVGDRRGALQVAWFDRRDPAAQQVVLTSLSPTGDWTVLGQAPAELRTRSETLPVSHVLAPAKGAWVLLSGCAATADGSGLVLRTFDEKGLSAPRLVPLEPAG